MTGALQAIQNRYTVQLVRQALAAADLAHLPVWPGGEGRLHSRIPPYTTRLPPDAGLTQAILLLAAAVLVVPILKRFGLAAVLGYLVAGVLIGPWGLKLVGEPEQILQTTEFGVVLLMFVIGLELQPSRLWVLRRAVFGLGGAQVVLCSLALGGIAMACG